MIDPPATIAAHLYITDVERRIPLRGDTMVERETNYATDIEAARADRQREVMATFIERGNSLLPTKVDELAFKSAIIAVIDTMIHDGFLSHDHRAEMMSTVTFNPERCIITFEFASESLERHYLRLANA